MTIAEYEEFVIAHTPKAESPRRLYRSASVEVPLLDLPHYVKEFYRVTNAHLLMPHYALCQDHLLTPTTDEEWDKDAFPSTAPVYLLSECQECWRVGIMRDAGGNWRAQIERNHRWRPLQTPIPEILIGHVFEMLTFNSYLTCPKSDKVRNPHEYGGMWKEETLEEFRSSTSVPRKLFTNRNEIIKLGWDFENAGVTEYWYDEDTRFLWRGENFEDSHNAVRLPHPRALLPEEELKIEQDALE